MAIENITSSKLKGQAIVELGFRLEKSAEVTAITGDQVIVKESIITEEVNAPSSHVHVIHASTPEYYDRLLHAVMQLGEPLIQVRLGVISGNDRMFLPWQDHQVTYCKAIPTITGHDIRLDTHDILYSMAKRQKVRARRGKISDIVRQIADEHQLESVVEPTASNGGETYIQSFLDDVDFIVNRLIPRAVNGKGQGNFRLFLKDNVLHFHSPDFQASVFQLDYFNKSASTMLTLGDHSQANTLEGAAGVTGSIHDPYTGQSSTLSHDPSRTLNLAAVTSRLREVVGADQPVRLHIGSNRVDEIQAMVQNLYETHYSSQYQAELTMEMMPLVRANDFINILVKADQAKSSPWSGPYMVVKVKHAINLGAMTSHFTMERGEQSSLGKNFQGLKSLGVPDMVIKENAAVGQLINLAAVKSSQKTVVGTSNQVVRTGGGEVLKTVQPV